MKTTTFDPEVPTHPKEAELIKRATLAYYYRCLALGEPLCFQQPSLDKSQAIDWTPTLIVLRNHTGVLACYELKDNQMQWVEVKS